METGSKKHVLAERWIDSAVPLNLCNLFISEFNRYKVLYLASSLSKQLVAYKVLTAEQSSSDEWLENPQILQRYSCDFNPAFDLVPEGFSQSGENTRSQNFIVERKASDSEIHILSGLAAFFKNHLGNSIYLNVHKDNWMTIAVFNGKNCLLANSYQFTDNTEILYYIISAVSDAGMDQADTNLYMDYEAWHATGLKEFLYPYFKRIVALSYPGENPDPEMDDLPSLLFSAYAISLCV